MTFLNSMLYKKYHRSYISQFRRGIKFSFTEFKLVEVLREPYSFENCIYITAIICRTKRDIRWPLIGDSGIILYKIKFIEDAVQEIS